MKIEVTLTIVVRMNEKLWKKKVISSEIYILSSFLLSDLLSLLGIK
jgi:hypothetical protein